MVTFYFYSCDAFSIFFALSLTKTTQQQLQCCVLISKGCFQVEHYGLILIHMPRNIDATTLVFPRIPRSDTFIMWTNCCRLEVLIFSVPQHGDKNMLISNMFLSTLTTCLIRETNTDYIPISPSNIKNISSMMLHVIFDMMRQETSSMMRDDTFIQH